MSWYLGKLWTYFGAIGIVSIGVWLFGLVAMMGLWLGRKRVLGIVAGIVVGNAAVILAKINSDNVSEIMPDQADRHARLERMRREQFGAATRPATQPAPGEAPKAAAYPPTTKPAGGEPKSIYEKAAEGKVVPEYRKRGKQKRAAGRREDDAVLAEVAREAEEQAQPYRTMPIDDVLRADRWDSWNLRACKGVLVVALLLFAVEVMLYCRGFNRTFGPRHPLPLAGWWMDVVSPKAHSTFVSCEAIEEVRSFLRAAARKGETFVYFGLVDPIEDRPLDRFAGFWPLPKLRWQADISDLPTGQAGYEAPFVLDAVWFGRCCCVIDDAASAKALIEELVRYLTMRRQTRARARRTVYLVWHRPDVLEERPLTSLRPLLRPSLPLFFQKWSAIVTTRSSLWDRWLLPAPLPS